MKIYYDTTLEDLVAFNRYHCDHSPSARRTMTLLKWSLPLLLVLALGCVAFEDGSIAGLVAAVIGLVLFGGLWLFLWPSYFRWSIDRHARRLYSEGANKGVIGPHELELIEDSLVERNPFGESSARLCVIEKIVTTEDFTFIYTSAMGAHVIPHETVDKGELRAFIDALEQRLAAKPTWASRRERKPGPKADQIQPATTSLQRKPGHE